MTSVHLMFIKLMRENRDYYCTGTVCDITAHVSVLIEVKHETRQLICATRIFLTQTLDCRKFLFYTWWSKK